MSWFGGLIRQNEPSLEAGVQLWTPAQSTATLLEHDTDCVVFGENIEECVEVLERWNPTKHSELSRVFHKKTGGYDNFYAGKYHPNPRVYVLPESLQCYAGKDFDTIVLLAKQFDTVLWYTSSSMIEGYKYDFQDSGCSINHGKCDAIARRHFGRYNNRMYTIKYNPKGVAAAVKASRTRARKKIDYRLIFAEVDWKLTYWLQVRNQKYVQYNIDSKSPFRTICISLRETLGYFEFAFGRHAWRAVEEFRRLKTAWKKIRETVFQKEEENILRCRDVRIIINFLDQEVLVRNGPLKKGIENWIPKRKARSFDELDFAPPAEAPTSAKSDKSDS